jgi:hypothetical protein
MPTSSLQEYSHLEIVQASCKINHIWSLHKQGEPIKLPRYLYEFALQHPYSLSMYDCKTDTLTETIIPI